MQTAQKVIIAVLVLGIFAVGYLIYSSKNSTTDVAVAPSTKNTVTPTPTPSKSTPSPSPTTSPVTPTPAPTAPSKTVDINKLLAENPGNGATA